MLFNKFFEDNKQMTQLTLFSEDMYPDNNSTKNYDSVLPFIGDGLIPLQRHIMYAMFELGLLNRDIVAKSGRIISGALRFSHSTYDECYISMIQMAQSIYSRYPLIDGQGNWGDYTWAVAEPAYTEAKFSKIAKTLVKELNQQTVDYQPSICISRHEPRYLPACLPIILLNGCINIGDSLIKDCLSFTLQDDNFSESTKYITNIPPHNINEVANALIKLLDNPQTSLAEILEIIKGPDYPTEAQIITPRLDIAKMYEQGEGVIKMRANWYQENGNIIISSFPYQVSLYETIEQIHQQRLPMIKTINNESSSDQIRIVLELTDNTNCYEVMSHLFTTTDLEKSYDINMNMIGLNGKSEIKNLLTILSEWLEFRRMIVARRLNYRLEKLIHRIHILEGLMVATLNTNEVIDIIFTAKRPKVELMSKFNLSNEQAKSILNLPLNYLSKVKTKLCALKKEKQVIQDVLSSDLNLNNFIKKEIGEYAIKFASPRRTLVT